MVLQTLYLIPEGTVFSNGVGAEDDDDWCVITLRTKQPIRVVLSYSDEEYGVKDLFLPWVWLLHCGEELNHEWAFGFTIEDAVRGLLFDFIAVWDCYVNEDEFNLTKGAIEFRETLKEFFEVA